MAEGFLGSIPGLDSLNVGGFFGSLGGIWKILLGVLIFLTIASIMFFILWKIKNRKLYNKKIHWFEEVNGAIVPVDTDLATEMTIPNTNITTFYIKKKDLYLPRPTKRMGKDSYWFVIKNNREIVNFTMKNINDEMKEGNLDYDHTDMRYALVNLRAMIQRNYRDNSKPWWREYKDVIGLVVLIFVLSLSFFFLISKVAELIDKAAILIEHADQLVKSAQTLRGSGVAQQ
ncbi:hypothetical protein LCGC14_2290490 [marine sediment metagenome]|uniref:Uncharacterized protein n=1 Tax=marine sediment metagenome TaxID=412755 RepID=A0A0F9F3X5_9ZZZZ